EPSVRWMIGVEGIWEGTGYEDLFLAPEGSPTGNAGQHSVARLDDDSLPEGQYYVEMFNNNHWFMGTRDEEVWADVGPDTAYPGDLDGQSHILRYLVDENAGTFSEDLRVDVAYSSVVSNVQRIGGDSLENPMVVNSGKANVFTEHAPDGQLLAPSATTPPTWPTASTRTPSRGSGSSAAELRRSDDQQAQGRDDRQDQHRLLEHALGEAFGDLHADEGPEQHHRDQHRIHHEGVAAEQAQAR